MVRNLALGAALMSALANPVAAVEIETGIFHDVARDRDVPYKIYWPDAIARPAPVARAMPRPISARRSRVRDSWRCISSIPGPTGACMRRPTGRSKYSASCVPRSAIPPTRSPGSATFRS